MTRHPKLGAVERRAALVVNVVTQRELPKCGFRLQSISLQLVTGQTAVSYTYDNANRLTQITRGTPTVSFAYDNANRRSSLTLPNGIVMSYSYDDSSELTAITYTHSGSTLGDLSYTYDLAGRRASMGGSYARVGLPLAVSSAVYNANNQLTQWGTASLFYDENGNMTSDGANNLAWILIFLFTGRASSPRGFPKTGWTFPCGV